MEFNKIAGAILLSLIVVMGVAKIGNTLVPPFFPPHDKPGVEGPSTTAPESKEPEKPVAELLATADPKAGESRAKACISCHSFEKGGPNKVGPDLWDIVGRKVASISGFAYSDAMKSHGGEWSWEQLAKYLHKPSEAVPGNKMVFQGVEDNADLAPGDDGACSQLSITFQYEALPVWFYEGEE